MERSKRSKPQGKDRLSELPDSLIFHVFWFIPMFDVVKTSILSKRWRNLWTTAPFLNFDVNTREAEFRDLVNQCLFRWNGVRILKFRLFYYYGWARDSDIEMWVMFAKEKGVEELDLCEEYFEYRRPYESCLVPQCLYSCSSSLKDLSINACRFRIDVGVDVKWDRLKSLLLNEVDVDGDLVNQFLRGSPKLEFFNLSCIDGCEKLNIHSNSLKELWICRSIGFSSYLSFDTELTIWAPNLETLKIKGIPWGKCFLENVSSLKRAILGFSGLVFQSWLDCCFGEIPFSENGFLSLHDFLADNIVQILQIIKQVDTVELICCCPEVLGAMTKRSNGSSFPNVKSLKMKRRFDDYDYDDYDQFVGLLEIFPELSRLVLKERGCCYHDQNDARSYLKLASNNPKSFLLNLSTVDITWSEGDNIFPFIEILLKYASKLEKMVFRVKGIYPSSLLESQKQLASNKLLTMSRFSQNCKIEIR